MSDDRTIPDVLGEVWAEIDRAVAKFPTWPTDPHHACAVLGEEFGELIKAVVQAMYEPGKATIFDVRAEAVQTAAMAIRFLLSMNVYDFTPGHQHRQSGVERSATSGSQGRTAAGARAPQPSEADASRPAPEGASQ